MEVPRFRVESELYLPAYTTATATPDPSCICNLNHSSRQRRIPNALSEARDRTCIPMNPSQIRFRCATTGTPQTRSLKELCNMQFYVIVWNWTLELKAKTLRKKNTLCSAGNKTMRCFGAHVFTARAQQVDLWVIPGAQAFLHQWKQLLSTAGMQKLPRT